MAVGAECYDWREFHPGSQRELRVTLCRVLREGLVYLLQALGRCHPPRCLWQSLSIVADQAEVVEPLGDADGLSILQHPINLEWWLRHRHHKRGPQKHMQPASPHCHLKQEELGKQVNVLHCC